MPWYFEPVERQLRLKAIMDTWIGTPFRHRGCVRGLKGGVDCIHFTAEVFKELGIIDSYELPKYGKDWHMHRAGEQLLAGIFDFADAHPTYALRDVGINNPMNGDVYMYKWGRASAHTSIYYDGLVYQVLTNTRVEEYPWGQDSHRRRFGLRVEE
jgi:hypothetical protein